MVPSCRCPVTKTHRLRAVAVGERDAGVGGAARGRGDAGHDLEGDALGGERLDLLAAAPEDEGVAALEAHDALALLGQAHQQVVDVLLRHRVLRALLAGVDALGVRAHEVEDRPRDQPVVDHDVGALHEAQRAEGEQVRIAGAGADQRHLAAVEGEARVLERLRERRARLVLAAAQHELRDRALQHVLPEAPALGESGSAPSRASRNVAREPGEAPVARGNQRLEARAQQAREHRRGAAARDRDGERRPLDDRGQDEGAERRLVDDVHRDAPRRGRPRPRPRSRPGRRSRRSPRRSLRRRRAEKRRARCEIRPADRCSANAARELRCHHRRRALWIAPGGNFSRGHVAAAHDEAGLVADVEEDGQVFHAIGRAGR